MNGDTLVVGAPAFGANVLNIGYADVFVRHQTIDGTFVWNHQQTVTPSGLTSVLEFGFGASLDLSGDDLVVGANRFNDGDGRAVVFRRQGQVWSQVQVLQPTVDIFDSTSAKSSTSRPDHRGRAARQGATLRSSRRNRRL